MGVPESSRFAAGQRYSAYDEAAERGFRERLNGGPISADLIADTANRSNEPAVMPKINFAAQVVDVDVDDIGHPIKAELPDLLDNVIAGYRLPFVSHQELEEGKFSGAKFDNLPGSVDVMCYAVYLEIINSQHTQFE